MINYCLLLIMSIKYKTEESHPESFVAFSLDGSAQGFDLICPWLVDHSILLPTTNESQVIQVDDDIAVSSQPGGNDWLINYTNGYFFPDNPWVAMEEGRTNSEQFHSGPVTISPRMNDIKQQADIQFQQQMSQSTGVCVLQGCALVENDEGHAKRDHDETIFMQITDSDSKNSVMPSQVYCENEASSWGVDVTFEGSTKSASRSKNCKCSQFLKKAMKRRGEHVREHPCVAKKSRKDAIICHTPHLLSKMVEATTEMIQLAPSCGQVVEVLRRSTIGHGQDIVYVQNEVTPWEPWITALRDEEGTLTVSSCSSRSSLIEIGGDIGMKMVKQEISGEPSPTPILQQCSSCQVQTESLSKQVKENLRSTCYPIIGSDSVMLSSLNEGEDHLNQMMDNTSDSYLSDTKEDIFKSVVDANYCEENLDSLHLFEELKDITSEDIGLQETGTTESNTDRFSTPHGAVLNDKAEHVSCDIYNQKQRHINDKCAFLLLEADRELRRMGIRGFSVRIGIDWHQLVVKDWYFGNTFVFPLDEVDFEDRNPVFEDILDKLTKDMYSVLTKKNSYDVRLEEQSSEEYSDETEDSYEHIMQ